MSQPLDKDGVELPPEEAEVGRIGVFSSWRAVYTTVVVYAILVIAVLYVLSVTLDFSSR